jgi:hypothetical protein
MPCPKGRKTAMKTFAGAGPTDAEMLLPWYAAGTLGPHATRQVESALAHNVALRRQYELIREELTETIRLNESLGAPTARVGERLKGALVADAATPLRKKNASTRWRRPRSWLLGLSPHGLKWSVPIAVLALLLQVGLIGDLSGLFRISDGVDRKPANDVYAFVSFAPEAGSSDITRFLHAHRAQVVEGPRANGIYKIRVEGSLSEDDVAALLEDIRQPNDVVRFIGTTSK